MRVYLLNASGGCWGGPGSGSVSLSAGNKVLQQFVASRQTYVAGQLKQIIYCKASLSELVVGGLLTDMEGNEKGAYVRSQNHDAEGVGDALVGR